MVPTSIGMTGVWLETFACGWSGVNVANRARCGGMPKQTGFGGGGNKIESDESIGRQAHRPAITLPSLSLQRICARHNALRTKCCRNSHLAVAATAT